ncbi:MAG: thermonuclease family protein [Pseudomonadota bacterium]
MHLVFRKPLIILVGVGLIVATAAALAASSQDRPSDRGNAADGLSTELIRGPVPAVVQRVIDGDTINVTAALWPDLMINVDVRLSDVDTPEIGGARCKTERRLGKAARDHVVRRVNNKQIELHNVRQGKYAGRVVADVSTTSGHDLGASLLDAQLARRYGDKDGWCGQAAPSFGTED